jgi:16S rRNA (guanine966-N2)-methyltransferase
MRIVAGRHRGRKLEVLAGLRVRPTADRAREALFNILEHGGWTPGGGSPLAGARVLDAFAGSGALGLEALSRGAAHASFMDSGRAALEIIRRNAEALGEERESVSLVRGDATDPPGAAVPVSIAFLDPPYDDGLAMPALTALAAAGWLAAGALAIVELPAREDAPEPPAGFAVLDDRTYGAARVVFLRYQG